MKVEIGKLDNGKVLSLDLDILLRTRLLIQANSGLGKSWLLRRLAEQMFGKVQVIIIDPEGEFATLREKFGYVLVGKGGETPADVRSAGLVAEKLLELGASAVCDIYEMKVHERHRWVRTFLDAMIDAPKKFWHPAVVIVDEAHQFAPEKGAGESEASEALISLATRGRKRGYAAIFATQRLGKLRKDAAAELLNVLIGGTFIDIDRKRAADSLGIQSSQQHSFFDAIKVLEPGQFYALGRALTLEKQRVRVGTVQTTHPEPGSATHAAEPPPLPNKVKALLPKLADLPRAAEEQARTVAEFKAEIRTLKNQLRAQPTKIEAREIKIVDQQAINRAVVKASNQYQQQIKKLQSGLASISKIASSLAGISMPEIKPSAPVIPLRPERRIPILAPKIRLAPVIHSDSETRLPIGEAKILRAIAQYPEGVERDQLSVLTGYKRSSRDAYVQRLKERGYIHTNGSGIVATDDGASALGPDFEPLPTGSDLQEYWLNRLPEGERKILQILIESYPTPVDRDGLEESTGYKRSSRDAYIQRLKARRIADIPSPGTVRASEVLFE